MSGLMHSTGEARVKFLATLVLAFVFLACDGDPAPLVSPAMRSEGGGAGDMLVSPDPTGFVATVSTTGGIDRGNPFFRSLGTNGRSCASCHLQENAWGLSAEAVRTVFAASGGTDPLFAAVDGANCPSVTAADGAQGHSLLLGSGLIRVAVPMPPNAEFTVTAVHDPYGCALQGSPQNVSMYRRPLPSTNLSFLSAVMFDGRETISPLSNGGTFLTNLRADLAHQAVDATLGHAQASAAPDAAQVNAIVDFELGLYTAQRVDNAAGVLNAQGASGGPDALTSTAYYPGINDPLGGNPTGSAFDLNAFAIYAAWQDLNSSNRSTEARKAIARGETVFNTHPLLITAVAGLNDDLGAPVIPGTCSTCHDTPDIGNHSLPVPLDIGTSHAAAYEPDARIAAALAQLSVPTLPVFRVTCTAGSQTGTARYTSDPGRAMITGRCADVGRIKGPILRGLAARAPFFHNGAAASLEQVVEFYNQRFQMGLTTRDKSDLVAFLKAL
jgi:hypothetical protein